MEIVEPLNKNELEPRLLEKFSSLKVHLVLYRAGLDYELPSKIADAFTDLNKAVMECKGKVTPEFKQLIGYITIFVSGCLYCQAHTILGAERIGCTKKKLEEVWNSIKKIFGRL